MAVLVLLVGQLSALIHAATVRHVLCALHGEQIDVPSLVEVGDDCGGTDVHAVDGQGGEHEDCVIARLLSSSIDRAHTPPVVAIATVASAIVERAPAAVDISTDLVLIAPKTSPPVLG